MLDIDFSQQLVEAKLAKLNISKSAGPDNIHPRVLKELKEVLSLPEEPKQLADEASRFHLGRQCQHSAVGHLLWRFAIQQQSTAPQSGHALLTQVGSMCS